MIAEHACDYVPKRILKLSAYRSQVFLVKDQYLRSLERCRNQAIHGQLIKDVVNMCLQSLQLYMPGFR